MNGVVGRRVFVGSLAGAGVGALGATSFAVAPSVRPNPANPLVREIRGQLKQAFGKMRNGHSGGARQAATVLRLYASTVDDGQLQAGLRKANRQQLLRTEMNHTELAREAKELGIDPSRLPPHAIDRVGREAAVDRLIKEGMSPFMRNVADYVDDVAEKMERLERRPDGAMAMQVALRQPPEQVYCGTCEPIQGGMDYSMAQATVVCAAAAAFPPLGPACAAASVVFLVYHSAYALCLVIVQVCESYYNNH